MLCVWFFKFSDWQRQPVPTGAGASNRSGGMGYIHTHRLEGVGSHWKAVEIAGASDGLLQN